MVVAELRTSLAACWRTLDDGGAIAMPQPRHDPQGPSDAVQASPIRWDFRREGRSWRGAEFKAKHDLVPGRLEAFDGRLCLGAEQRLVLLALLLENIGLDWTPSSSSVTQNAGVKLLRPELQGGAPT